MLFIVRLEPVLPPVLPPVPSSPNDLVLPPPIGGKPPVSSSSFSPSFLIAFPVPEPKL